MLLAMAHRYAPDDLNFPTHSGCKIKPIRFRLGWLGNLGAETPKKKAPTDGRGFSIRRLKAKISNLIGYPISYFSISTWR